MRSPHNAAFYSFCMIDTSNYFGSPNGLSNLLILNCFLLSISSCIQHFPLAFLSWKVVRQII